MKNEDQLKSPAIKSTNFAAYIPVYDNGNAVMAITKDGQAIMIDKSMKALLNTLLKEYSVDIRLLRKNLLQYTDKKNIIPVPLSMDTLLIPAKVRKAIAINDGTYAYVDLYSIEKISGDKTCTISLKCGREIEAIESERTVRSRMNAGSIIMEEFSARLLGGVSPKECISGINREIDMPATKRDITLLAYEIMKLRSILHNNK